MVNCGHFVECIGDIVRAVFREMWGGELWAVCGVYWVYCESSVYRNEGVVNCGQFVECTGDIVRVLCRVMWGGELWTVCGVYWEYRESFV